MKQSVFYPVSLSILTQNMFSDAWDYSTVHTRHSLHRSQTYDEWVSVTPLIPMSVYSVQMNASNTVGLILGNVMTANMPPGCE